MEIIVDMYKDLAIILRLLYRALTRRNQPVSALRAAFQNTGAFILLALLLLVSFAITLLSLSGWALLLMRLLLSADPGHFTGFFSGIVPVLSGMTWFKVAVPVSFVVLFLHVLQSTGFSITRSVAYWRHRRGN